ncbi:type VI secretion system ATPase TssH [Aquabacterium sp.]|uniref:type VI secretion system ATPase TssH n=1 Tax=Aquabacterium sp. TaxID=1872578 RepID=UPI0035B21DE0
MSLSLKTLISKLNDTTRRAAERAANQCLSRGHHEVDLEHLLLALLDDASGDICLICGAQGVDAVRLRNDLESELRRFRDGNTRTPVFSVRLQSWLEHAWLIASLEGAQPRIRGFHLLLAMLTDPGLRQVADRVSAQFERFDVVALKHHPERAVAGSVEQVSDTSVTGDDVCGAGGDAAVSGRVATPALDQYTTNLTARASAGEIDPVIGRDTEIRQVMDILMRRRQNNPILTGEAGVGKTAVVEGLALRVAQGDVPAALAGVAIHVLDMGLLQAGASVKGEFENRLKGVIDEVKRSPQPIILFIDEAHTMIGAGGQAGQNDAANLLKPALARGELRTIAATTWGEYKKYFEKDAALARRFQVVKVEEPSELLACAMLRGMVPLMEQHFGVRLLDEAISEAVRLSSRYISDRQLPDKAVSVLDTACARVALGQRATPGRIDDARKQLVRIDAEVLALSREQRSGAAHGNRIDDLQMIRLDVAAQLAADESQWEQEQRLVQSIWALRLRMEAGEVLTDIEQQTLLEQRQALRALQGDAPLVPVQVDGHVVAEVISGWTGIPLGKMVKDEIDTVRRLQRSLQERVMGQDHALAAIAERVRTARAGLEDPNKPKGVFLFVGPSGVGKTETALALADILYGGERNLITINMSEYQEAHSVSGLKGSPPGYVGYGEGGVLTEAVRRKPYSVVLLDEVEKAHPDVLEMFFQVFDKGVMDDAEGREIDFRNTIIILTSNAGSQGIMQACFQHDETLGGSVMKTAAQRPAADELAEMLRPTLYKVFKPAFVGRTKVVPYYPLADEVLMDVIRLKLDRIAQRFASQHKADMRYEPSLLEAVLDRCTEVDTGARAVDHILNGTLLPQMADVVLDHMAEGRAIQHLAVGVGEAGQFAVTVA